MATSSLRTKPVYRNIEGNFTLLGIPAEVVGLVVLLTVTVVMTAGTSWGLYAGAVALALSAALLSGKDRLWALNGILYLLRRDSVLVAAAPEPAIEGKLHEARKLHEAE